MQKMGNTSVCVKITNNTIHNVVAIEVNGSRNFTRANSTKFNNVQIKTNNVFETTFQTTGESPINLKFLYDNDDIDEIEIIDKKMRQLQKTHRVKFIYKNQTIAIVLINTIVQNLIKEADDLMKIKQFEAADKKLMVAFKVDDEKILQMVEKKCQELQNLKMEYINELISKANANVEEKKYLEALVKFEDAFQLSNDHQEKNRLVIRKAQVLNELGKAVLKDAWLYDRFTKEKVGSKFKEAEILFREALTLVETNIEYQYNLKRVLIKQELDSNRYLVRKMEDEAQQLLELAFESKEKDDYERVKQKYEEIYEIYLLIGENINEGLRNSDRNFEVFAEINANALKTTAATLETLKS